MWGSGPPPPQDPGAANALPHITFLSERTGVGCAVCCVVQVGPRALGVGPGGARVTVRVPREPPGSTECSARCQHTTLFFYEHTKGFSRNGAQGHWANAQGPCGAWASCRTGGSTEQGEQQQWAGLWPGKAAAHHQHPDPVEVSADVGVDHVPVGPAAAHSPAHDSNLIPQPVPQPDQGPPELPWGAAWVSLARGRAGGVTGRPGGREGLSSWAYGVQILPSGVRMPLQYLQNGVLPPTSTLHPRPKERQGSGLGVGRWLSGVQRPWLGWGGTLTKQASLKPSVSPAQPMSPQTS